MTASIRMLPKFTVCLVRITVVLIEPLLILRYVIRKEKRNEL